MRKGVVATHRVARDSGTRGDDVPRDRLGTCERVDAANGGGRTSSVSFRAAAVSGECLANFAGVPVATHRVAGDSPTKGDEIPLLL